MRKHSKYNESNCWVNLERSIPTKHVYISNETTEKDVDRAETNADVQQDSDCLTVLGEFYYKTDD